MLKQISIILVITEIMYIKTYEQIYIYFKFVSILKSLLVLHNLNSSWHILKFKLHID